MVPTPTVDIAPWKMEHTWVMVPIMMPRSGRGRTDRARMNETLRIGRYKVKAGLRAFQLPAQRHDSGRR